MKRLISLLLILFAFLPGQAAASSSAKDLEAIHALAARVVPAQAEMFVFEIAPYHDDEFEISTADNGKIRITGNNANSMATGLNHYLKYLCNVEIGWFKHDTYTLPAVLPQPEDPIHVKARAKDRFFLNYCTFGYTMPWWEWEEWEHFIDWMALNGINLPLSITGQESIWEKVWTELGLTQEEVRSYFTGPSHLPWHRMLNIDYWGGPLPQSWLDGQLKLQQKITARERELNMRPVLPAFAGHVPAELKRIYPDAKITKLEAWAGYPDEYACSFLDPMDPLFTKIQKKFIDTETELYGTDHIYGIDLFNELTPPSWDPKYLGRVSKQVYQSLEKADPKAVWLQMTWLFYNERKDWTNDRVNPYITSYPRNRSILLDYYCESQEVWQRTEQYYGVPYIWCYLGNFGGNTMLAGDLHVINERLENTMKNGGKNFRGIGSTLEGFDCNPFIYDYIFEKAWDNGLHTDVAAWTEALADQRVGKPDANGREAWKILVDSIYVGRSVPGHCPLINIRPTFGKFRTYYANPRLPYDNANLLLAAQAMLKADGEGDAYEFDVTNVVRQLLSNYFLTSFREYEKAYNDRNRKEMALRRIEMESILVDLEELLGTQTYFLLGKWIDDARKWGITPEEKDYFESNARNLITTWGDRDQLLNDYASRTLNGMVSGFYAPRWTMFFDAVDTALDNGGEFGEPEYEAFKKNVCDFEKNWWTKRIGTYPSSPSGDSKAIATRLLKKYGASIAANEAARK